MKILVTGANGFIGKSLLQELHSRGIDAVGGVRSGFEKGPFVKSPSLSAEADWRNALRGIDVVIHTAGMAHIVVNPEDQGVQTLHEINALGTARLAEQAAAAGVKRFVFLSSIGVNGNTTAVPFKADDMPRPVEPYAVSKLAAESLLDEIAERSGMEVVVVRPPLVYGKDAPGNFGRLVKLVEKGLPLPIGSVSNHRSFVSVDNLADLLIVCAAHPSAAGQVFLAADGEDLSTAELIRKIAYYLKRPSRVFPFPVPLLKAGARLVGKYPFFIRLCGSLQVDISKNRTLLGWEPPVSIDESLRRALRS